MGIFLYKVVKIDDFLRVLPPEVDKFKDFLRILPPPPEKGLPPKKTDAGAATAD